MADETKLTVIVNIRDTLDAYSEEDVAKNLWPYFIPFLTRRHGIDSGRVILENGAIEVSWEYKDNYSEDVSIDEEYYDEEYYG